MWQEFWTKNVLDASGPPTWRSLRWQDHSTCVVRCRCCHRGPEAEKASSACPGLPQQHGAGWKEAPVPRQVPSKCDTPSGSKVLHVTRQSS